MKEGGSQKQDRARKILIAVDASEHSFEAVRYVGRILPPEGTRITLLHILSPALDDEWNLEPDSESNFHSMDDPTRQARQKTVIQDFMKRSISMLADLGHTEDAITILIKERELSVARDISREAEADYDALVVGRRGMSAVRDLIIGSIANKLVSHLTRQTIWVVGDRPDPAKILIAMDDSNGAGRAVEYVGNLFGPAHPELLLLHVAQDVDPSKTDYEGDSPEVDWVERTAEEIKKAESVMNSVFEECIRRLERQGADASRIETRIVPGIYSRATAIFGEALEEGCGAIVVGRRGLSRVEEISMGRVSTMVLQLAQEMAVWVVH
jgi:nucleotide-binding universal stress UspA family protein